MEQDKIPLAPGDIVEGLEADELVEIRKITSLGRKILLEGEGLVSNQAVRRPLTERELSELIKVRGEKCSFDGNAELFLLGVEAERIRIAHQFDPLFAVNSSIVDPLPHQVEAVYRYLLPLPRIRFLLADDTGAGKTIMAGLLIKELRFRGILQKVLIITPGGLTKQWAEDELQEKFGLYVRLVNRATFEAEPGQFSRNEEGIFVTSVDFLARNEGCLKAVSATHWDLIVVDEAHKLSAYEYGKKLEESERYKAVKALSGKTDHLLFLTATPHRGRKDTFRRLLLLLDEDLFQKDEHVDNRIGSHAAPHEIKIKEDFEAEQPISNARNRFFLRRLKEEMVDWDGQPLFKSRHTKTIGYRLTSEEKNLYDRVTNYVRSKRKEAKAKKNQNVELTLMVMQRRLASSIHAITKTLERRLQALNEVLLILADSNLSDTEKKRLLQRDIDQDDPRNIIEYEDLTEEEREHIDSRIFRQVLTADPGKVEEERDEVEFLFLLASGLKNHHEAKFGELLDVLDSSDVIRADDEKLLIFTEHLDTLNSLEQRLEEKGYQVAKIHGGMNVDMRKQAQRQFRRQAKIMVATDAAGEGINLQFCRYLINWDLPWNPNRIEQRMGRIHRYGQAEDVWVYNLVAQNTREGAVLERILSKMDTMREQMGTDRVYDVIDEWMEGVPLAQLIEQAIDSDDEPESIQETDLALQSASNEKAEELIDLQKKASLASPMDLLSARELQDSSDENRLQPLFIQRFFERAWVACGGSFQADVHSQIFHIGATPTVILDLARERRQMIEEHYGSAFVFDKQLISIASKVHLPEQTKLLGPGHNLFNILIEWAIIEARQAFAKGAVLIDPNITKAQRIWLTRSIIHDGRSQRYQYSHNSRAHERLSVIMQDHVGLRTISPSYLLNYTAPEANTQVPDIESRSKQEIEIWAYEQITEPQLDEAKASRHEECNLRREYLTSAFKDLILELQGKLNDFQHAQLFGDDNVAECERLQKRIEDLNARKAERLKELDLMETLSANLPEILTEAIILPATVVSLEEEDELPSKGFPMHRDDEVEAIAMRVTTDYERSRGWSPTDVSQDGEHYDIRSEGPDGSKRFIEVKGRAQSGPIIITSAELDKLRQLGKRAWLYVITFCKSEQPRLCIIQDPGSKLTPALLFRQIQYMVEESDWGQQGREVEVQEEENR
ncbi:MAG: helicase-related protein [Bacteroidota bacterium]|nr:helicase-related protein [Bacteroidota bacterium]